MLPATARLRLRTEFVTTLRRGRRGRSSLLAVHLHQPVQQPVQQTADPPPGPSAGSPRIGFVVSRTVGPAVVRNQVRRRLRHLMADRLTTLPAGSRVVVRAFAPAATASSAVLGAALDRALRQASDPSTRAPEPVAP